MPRRGSEEEALADGQARVVEREGVVASVAPGGLVRFVEDAEVESLVRLHRFADDVCRLVGGKDNLRAGEGRVEKFVHAGGVGRYLGIEVGLRRGDGIRAFLHRRVGADAEIGEHRQARLVKPFVEGLAYR